MSDNHFGFGDLGWFAKLADILGDGSDEAVVTAGKLTLDMIAETATWFDGKGESFARREPKPARERLGPLELWKPGRPRRG